MIRAGLEELILHVAGGLAIITPPPAATILPAHVQDAAPAAILPPKDAALILSATATPIRQLSHASTEEHAERLTGTFASGNLFFRHHRLMSAMKASVWL
jgi:hypothetical protein